MSSEWGTNSYGAQNYFGDAAHTATPDTTDVFEAAPAPINSPEHAHEAQPQPEPVDEPQATDPEPAAEQPGDDTEQPETPAPAKPKPAAKASAKPSEADVKRIARRAVAAYDAFRQADEREIAVAAVYLDTSGPKRLDRDQLAIALISAGKADQTDKTVATIIDTDDPMERLVTILSLQNDERSRVWRVLSALDAIAGSPATSDVIGTSRRLESAFAQLSDENKATIAAAQQLLTVR